MALCLFCSFIRRTCLLSPFVICSIHLAYSRSTVIKSVEMWTTNYWIQSSPKTSYSYKLWTSVKTVTCILRYWTYKSMYCAVLLSGGNILDKNGHYDTDPSMPCTNLGMRHSVVFSNTKRKVLFSLSRRSCIGKQIPIVCSN